MYRLRQALLAGLVCGTSLLVAAPAGAAPGNGPIAVPTFCSVDIPGYGEATGPGSLAVLPNGDEVVHCNAQLPAGTPRPEKALTLRSGSCLIVLSSSGHVAARCRL
jgi:hypothetical protein